MRLRIVLPIVAVLAWSTTAGAEPRRHDGFYARFGIGPGYAIAELNAPGETSASGGVDVSTEIALGWTIRPRLVLGGGTFPMVVPAPSYDGVDAGGQHVSATGPFVTWYANESGGLHLQGGILFAAGYLDGGTREAHTGFGVGAMIGAGWDRFIADQWSVGGLVRITAYHLYGVDDDIGLLSPALLLTLTCH